MGEKKSLGIYIHIPFCIRKCAYCDFLSFTSDAGMRERYVDRLIREIGEYGGSEKWKVSTIFIGGGTPSMLEPVQTERVLNAVHENFFVDPDAEVTTEANPGTLTKDKLRAYKRAGINRISLGLQSAHNGELKLLGRIHSWEDFLAGFYMARDCGFSNINVDLMSALPGQTLDSWRDSVERVMRLGTEHISAYSLIIEEGTPFYQKYSEDARLRERGEPCESLPSEETERRMYDETKRMLEDKGYFQYEISNYAKPGYECRHNQAYWLRKDYLGFGLGAASLIHNVRFHNTECLDEYLENHLAREDVQALTVKEQMEETMFLGLRMKNGISPDEFREAYRTPFETVYGRTVKKLEAEGLLLSEGGRIRLTQKGTDLGNYVMAQFLMDD